jgi:hypothetical protein
LPQNGAISANFRAIGLGLAEFVHSRPLWLMWSAGRMNGEKPEISQLTTDN